MPNQPLPSYHDLAARIQFESDHNAMPIRAFSRGVRNFIKLLEDVGGPYHTTGENLRTHYNSPAGNAIADQLKADYDHMVAMHDALTKDSTFLEMLNGLGDHIDNAAKQVKDLAQSAQARLAPGPPGSGVMIEVPARSDEELATHANEYIDPVNKDYDKLQAKLAEIGKLPAWDGLQGQARSNTDQPTAPVPAGPRVAGGPDPHQKMPTTGTPNGTGGAQLPTGQGGNSPQGSPSSASPAGTGADTPTTPGDQTAGLPTDTSGSSLADPSTIPTTDPGTIPTTDLMPAGSPSTLDTSPTVPPTTTTPTDFTAPKAPNTPLSTLPVATTSLASPNSTMQPTIPESVAAQTALPVATEAALAGTPASAANAAAARGPIPPFYPPPMNGAQRGGGAGAGIKPGTAERAGGPDLGLAGPPAERPENVGVPRSLRRDATASDARPARRRKKRPESGTGPQAAEVLDEQLWQVEPPAMSDH
jgi:hypothetical protein